jgi:asparagine synthase (glutamine-hydrolysing)
MCGIFGFFDTFGVDCPPEDLLGRMARTLRHRGPDDSGFFSESGVGLGCSRLAIVDLETGRQPLANETGRLRLVCNGEIYNADSLRKELEGTHGFRTRSDSEVVLHLYEESGSGALDRLEGMFGLALWDSDRRRLLLARDRAGEKPMFFAMRQGVLYFASEISALRQVEDVGTELDPAALRLYLTLGYFPSPWTPYKGVRKLGAGTFAVIEDGWSSPRISTYWSLRPHALAGATEAAPMSEAEAARLLREKLSASVARQLMADVPVGVALSGGIDSGFIASIMASRSPEPIDTFTVSFSDPSYDEGDAASKLARSLGAVHHVARADSDSLARALGQLARHLDEPLGDPAVLPTFLLAEEARRHVKVLLGGEGADELFGGYPTYLGHRLASGYSRWPRLLRQGVVRPLVEGWPASERKVSIDFLLKRFVRAAERPMLERHVSWFGALSPEDAARLPGPLLRDDIVGSGGPDAVAVLRELAGEDGEWGGAELEKLLYLDFLTYLGEGLLTKLDRVAMACSVENRSPYLDREVVELAARLPLGFKVRGLETKRVLRMAARPRVPEELIRRRKRGLSVPLARLFRCELKELLRVELDRRRLDREGLLDGEAVNRLVDEHQSRSADRSRALWTVLALVLWYRHQALGRERESAAAASGTSSVFPSERAVLAGRSASAG